MADDPGAGEDPPFGGANTVAPTYGTSAGSRRAVQEDQSWGAEVAQGRQSERVEAQADLIPYARVITVTSPRVGAPDDGLSSPRSPLRAHDEYTDQNDYRELARRRLAEMAAARGIPLGQQAIQQPQQRFATSPNPRSGRWHSRSPGVVAPSPLSVGGAAMSSRSLSRGGSRQSNGGPAPSRSPGAGDDVSTLAVDAAVAAALLWERVKAGRGTAASASPPTLSTLRPLPTSGSSPSALRRGSWEGRVSTTPGGSALEQLDDFDDPPSFSQPLELQRQLRFQDEDQEALRAGEHEAELVAARDIISRERAALRDVAERVRSNAHDDIAAAAATWAAERHALDRACADDRAAYEMEADAAAHTVTQLRGEHELERTTAEADFGAAREAWDSERERMRQDTAAAGQEATARLDAAVVSFEPERQRLETELQRAHEEIATMAAAGEEATARLDAAVVSFEPERQRLETKLQRAHEEIATIAAAGQEATARLDAAVVSFGPERQRLETELQRAREEIATMAAASEARRSSDRQAHIDAIGSAQAAAAASASAAAVEATARLDTTVASYKFERQRLETELERACQDIAADAAGSEARWAYETNSVRAAAAAEVEAERAGADAAFRAAQEAWNNERDGLRRDAAAAEEEATARIAASIASIKLERQRLEAELERAREETATVAAASEVRRASDRKAHVKEADNNRTAAASAVAAEVATGADALAHERERLNEMLRSAKAAAAASAEIAKGDWLKEKAQVVHAAEVDRAAAAARYDNCEREHQAMRRARDTDIAALRTELATVRDKNATECTQLASAHASELAVARESAVHEREGLTREHVGVKSAAYNDLVTQREAWTRERSGLISAAAAAEVRVRCARTEPTCPLAQV